MSIGIGINIKLRSQLGGSFNPASVGTLLQKLATGTALTTAGIFYDTSGGDARPIQVGRCYVFDGTDDYIDYGDVNVVSFERTDAFSVEVNYKSGSTSSQAIIGKMLGSGTLRGWEVSIVSPGKIRFYLISTWSSNAIAVETTVGYSDGNYHNVVCSYDGSSSASGVVIEIDGVAVDISTVQDSLSATTDGGANLSLGSRNLINSEFNGSQFGAKIRDSTGAIVWFSKSDEQDGTTSYDSSGNGNDGVITNATLSTFHATQNVISFQNDVGYTDGTGSNGAAVGVFIPRDEAIPTQDVEGNALQYKGRVPYNGISKAASCANLDGSNDYITTPIASNFATDYVLFTEFNPDAVSVADSGAYRLFQTTAGGSTRFGLGIDSSRVVMFYNTGSFTLSGGVDVSIGDNVKACVRKSGTTLQLFVDGVLIDSVTGTLNSVNDAAINIGASNVSPSRWFNGKVWNTQFYSDPLTEAQCLALTTTGDVQDADSLVLHYPMAEGSNSTVYDKYGNDGTITNATLSSFWGSTQDTYFDNLANGFSLYEHATTDPIHVPYLNGSPLSITPPSGYTKTSDNPAISGHNGAESTIDFTGGVASPAAVIGSWETAWAFNSARTNPLFRRGGTKTADRFLSYETALTGSDLAKIESYVGQ